MFEKIIVYNNLLLLFEVLFLSSQLQESLSDIARLCFQPDFVQEQHLNFRARHQAPPALTPRPDARRRRSQESCCHRQQT